MESAHRDLSRAHWQRSEGAFLFSEFADQAFNLFDEITDMAHLNRWVMNVSESLDIPLYATNIGAWKDLFSISKMAYEQYFRACGSSFINPDRLPGDALVRVSEHCHFNSPAVVMHEAVQTTFSFPLHVARALNERHETDNSQPLFRTTREITEVIGNSDFRRMISNTALTRNSYWGGHYSALDFTNIDMALHKPTKFKFIKDESSSVGYTLDSSELLAELRHVNRAKNLDPFAGTPKKPSSGCPARYAKPRFHASDEDLQSIADLARAFATSSEYVVAERPRTALDIGLDSLQLLLERITTTHAAQKAAKLATSQAVF